MKTCAVIVEELNEYVFGIVDYDTNAVMNDLFTINPRNPLPSNAVLLSGPVQMSVSMTGISFGLETSFPFEPLALPAVDLGGGRLYTAPAGYWVGTLREQRYAEYQFQAESISELPPVIQQLNPSLRPPPGVVPMTLTQRFATFRKLTDPDGNNVPLTFLF